MILCLKNNLVILIKDSLVLPNLDIKLLVPKRDDSLLAHTFQDFEVVVVDDYSTDSSCKVIESYAPKFDGRLRPHRLKENSGSGGVPRNKGNLFLMANTLNFWTQMTCSRIRHWRNYIRLLTRYFSHRYTPAKTLFGRIVCRQSHCRRAD